MWARTLALHLSLCLLLVAPSFATKKPPAQPININAADSTQLQLVPGIGPSTAEKILQMRKSYGAFKSVNDLMAIRGLGPKHPSTRQCENKTPHAHKIRTDKIRRDTEHAAPATIDRAGCPRNRGALVII
jgi:competence ComEA-like helix-hairpin-helix protein